MVDIGGGTSTNARNIIDYVTIATTGNASDFGDLATWRTAGSGSSNSTRGLFVGGSIYVGNTDSNSNTIDYITIATTGNSTDFGYLTFSS